MDYKSQVRAAGIGWLPLYCPRHQSDGFEAVLVFKGIDLTASTVQAQVRLLPDSAALLESITVGTITFDGTDTSIPLTLTQAQTKAFPEPSETGDKACLYWDMWIDGKVMLAGTFDVIAGVVQ